MEPVEAVYHQARGVKVTAIQMPQKRKKTAKVVNPKSLANLIHEGRPLAFDEEKKRRTLTVTESGWEGAMAVAKELDCRGISELLELIGRKQLLVHQLPPPESVSEDKNSN
ncbi:hypothetical protein ACKFKF_15050 [Phormidesmis sp. 146-12]